jgi:predicted transposase YbfD/YdcC
MDSAGWLTDETGRTMAGTTLGDLRVAMAKVKDPRDLRGIRHPLPAVLSAVVCAVLCGANGYQAIGDWLHSQSVDFWHFLGFKRRPLSAGGLRLVLMALDPEAFEAALNAWLAPLRAVPSESSSGSPALSAIAIDGKTLRGSDTLDRAATLLVAAFDHQTSTVLKQQAVPAGTNEQKAALDLLKHLVLTGRVITADALHCQTETCQQILDSGGDFVLTVKANQPTLEAAIASEFAAQDAAFSPLPTAATASRTDHAHAV